MISACSTTTAQLVLPSRYGVALSTSGSAMKTTSLISMHDGRMYHGQGTCESMDDFDLSIAYLLLSSDEGPPYGRAGIAIWAWDAVAAAHVRMLVRRD